MMVNQIAKLEKRAPNAIGVPVEAAGAGATVLGAGVLAAVGSGTIGSLAEAAERLPVDRRVEPHRHPAGRVAEHERWRSFVAAAAELRSG
jgi:sugar (pentulose or hexulose) kinase